MLLFSPHLFFSFPFQGPPGPYGNPGLPGPPGAKVSICCGVWRYGRGVDAGVKGPALGEASFLRGFWQEGLRVSMEDPCLGHQHSLKASQVPGPGLGWRRSEELGV